MENRPKSDQLIDDMTNDSLYLKEYSEHNGAREKNDYPNSITINQKNNTSNSSFFKKTKKFWFFWLGILAVIGKFLKPLLILLKPLVTALKASKFAGTIISMIITVWIYATIWGWWFALGFVFLLFVHENGHMLAAKRIGLPVSKPVFIPFVGAFIAMKEMPKTARQEAIVGAGGPLVGTAGSLVCALAYWIIGNEYWLALAYVGFLINLFNLVPVGMLDGGRIVSAISYWLWLPGIVILGYLGLKFHSPIIFLVLIFGIIRVYEVIKEKDKQKIAHYYQVEQADRIKITLVYVLMLAVCGAGMGISHSILQDSLEQIMHQN